MLSEMKKSTGRKIQAEEQVEKCRSVYAVLLQRGDVCSAGIDRCDDSVLNLRPFPVQTEETGATGNKSVEKRPATVESGFANRQKETMICLSTGIGYYLRFQVQWTLGTRL